MLRKILSFLQTLFWAQVLVGIFACVSISNAAGVIATAIEYGNNGPIALAAVSAHSKKFKNVHKF